MSWFQKIISDYWGGQTPPTRVEDDTFTIIDKEIELQLAEAIASHLPREGEKFKTALANRFNLTLMSELGEKGPTKVWLTVLEKRGGAKQTLALRITRVDTFGFSDTRKTFFSLNRRTNLFGVEWHIFLPDASHLPRPKAAVAWNHTKGAFEILMREQITQHYEGTKPFEDPYTLYATLSPYVADGSPLYLHSMLDEETHDTISPYIPHRQRSLFRFTLATALRNLRVVKPLGEGSFSQVWQVTFTSIDNTERSMALKLAKTETIGQEQVRENYFQISRDRFGGEFGAFLPEGPYILSSFYAIVWDEEKRVYRLMDREEINGYHKYPESIGTNVFTLYGTLSECHEGARTLEELMQSGETLDVETIKNYAYQLLLGLAEFPEGMIHRDLKPANILVTEDGFLKILDFGFSAVGMDVAQSTLGSPLYMPPEVHQQTTYDQKADLYSLFCIFFKMATGEYPIPAKNFPELRAKMAAAISGGKDPKDDPRLERFDPEFRNFLSRLGHISPEQRWTLHDVLQKDCFLQGEMPPVRPDEASIIPNLIPTTPASFLASTFLSNASKYIPSLPSLKGRVHKLLIIGGAAFVLYHLARRAFILWNKPRWKNL
ncbi:MAG: serine/threonine-protein kinase [Simkaniaceae bacterium]|nr:MAG: serine/threonine-protein kinase [Simkaniaceae bacterium]